MGDGGQHRPSYIPEDETKRAQSPDRKYCNSERMVLNNGELLLAKRECESARLREDVRVLARMGWPPPLVLLIPSVLVVSSLLLFSYPWICI